MALDTLITGSNLDAGGNIKTALTNTPAYIGGVRMFSENDPGDATGTAYLKSPETSPDYRLRVGIDTIMFTDTFNALTQNTTLWSYTFATMTCSQPGNGYLQFGTVQGTTSAHGCMMRTFQYFPVVGTAPLSVEFKAGVFTSALVAGEIFIAGLGLPGSAILAPTDGTWFKITSAGVIGELSYNGVVTQTGVLQDTVTLGQMAKYAIVVGEEEVEFWADDVLLGEIAVPHANGQPFIAGSLPTFMQRYNTGAVSNTAVIRASDVTVSLLDVNTAKPWSHQVAGMGQHALFGQNGHTQGKTTIWTNNTAPTAVALTNTAAAFTGLGGIVAVLPTLTANNDGKLITYQNPAATINITGRNLYITRVTLNGAVSVILAGGPVIYALALAVGHTATSLATAESASFATATGHAPRIMPIGIQSYAATAPVGTVGGLVDLNFDVPIVVRPGEFVDIVARNIGTVTTTGAITFTISIGGYWE
jgi:hypothetical protein